MSYLTTEFQNHLDKSIKESYKDYSNEALEKSAFSRLFEVGDTDEYVESFTSMEGLDSPVYLDESENIKNGTVGEGYKTSVTSREFALSLTLPYKYRIRSKDNTTKLMKLAESRTNMTIQSMLNFVETQTHAMLNNGFTSQLAPDGASLFGTHTWKSTNKTFSNIPSGTKDLATDAIDDIVKYGGAFTDATGQEMPISFDTIVVKKGGSASRAALKLFAPNGSILPEVYTNINIYEAAYRIIESPYITSDTAYFLSDSTKVNSLFVNFTDRPSIQDKRVNPTNEDWIYNAMASFKFGVRDMPFDWVGSLGTNA